MSAPQKEDNVAPIKGQSLRDSLAKTVRLLTKSGIDVAFRGHQPHVIAKGNRAVRLVLPEINDDASPDLIEAIQGYLDHEVGHIYYTPFARAGKFAGDKKTRGLANIIEDIRLEKLLPRDLPGTKENLERMYAKFIPLMIDPGTRQSVESGDPGRAFSGVMVPAMRALAGQKAFQEYMDVNGYWQHFRPLIIKMPDLSKRLREMETYEDVEALVEDIMEAMKPPPKPAEPEPEDDAKDQDDADSDDEGDDGCDSSGGEGDGDGEGSDDGEEDENSGDCAGNGDGDGDDEGDGGDKDGDDKSDKGDKDGDDKDDEGDDGKSTSDADKLDSEEPKGSGKDGKKNLSLTDALKKLEPKQRRALFLYKSRNQTPTQIAQDDQINETEDAVIDLLRDARRRLRELMSGDKK